MLTSLVTQYTTLVTILTIIYFVYSQLLHSHILYNKAWYLNDSGEHVKFFTTGKYGGRTREECAVALSMSNVWRSIIPLAVMNIYIYIDLVGKHMHSDMQAGKRIKLHEGHEDLLDAVEAVCSRTPSLWHICGAFLDD